VQGRTLTLALLPVLLLAGCGEEPTADTLRPATLPAAGSAFDPATAATVRGRVTWAGPLPDVAPLVGWGDPGPNEFLPRKIVRKNPNASAVDAASRGVASAVVFLRGVDPARGRTWDHAPVRVVQRDLDFHVLQGDAEVHVGFVRRGDAVTLASEGPEFHVLHAAGAAYFSLPFPDTDWPYRRRLSRRGLVELTSEAGYFWMHAYLFVDDHPYYARTDAQGCFELPRVPPGSYELVCWLPNWHEAAHDRDPETSGIIRVRFRPPVEKAQPVLLGPGQTRDASFSLSADGF
jgi:hypothetical protein